MIVNANIMTKLWKLLMKTLHLADATNKTRKKAEI